MPWIFGPQFEGHPRIVEMRELKRFNVATKARAFKTRTEAYFLRQVDTLTSDQAPFPLALMTCVGIEMIGAYKYGDAFADRNGHFKRLLKDMSPRFGEIQTTPEGKCAAVRRHARLCDHRGSRRRAESGIRARTISEQRAYAEAVGDFVSGAIGRIVVDAAEIE
ncbi:MAG TPA: hypothetical protein VFB04_06180 [Terriglobales bacterium]|nr:hypothetical protein [Terriglobales bacterium]